MAFGGVIIKLVRERLCVGIDYPVAVMDRMAVMSTLSDRPVASNRER